MFTMKKYLYLSFIAIAVIFLTSCSDNPSSPDLKTGIAGTWLVTRTLVTPSKDFPNGYKDQQTWEISTNGDAASLTVYAGGVNVGTISGQWTKSQNFGYDHWYFEYEGQDPRTGFQIKIIVEIINAGPLKATDETYVWDKYANMYTLSDSFSCEGAKQ